MTEIGKPDHDFERAVEGMDEGAVRSMYYAQRNRADQAERYRTKAEARIRELERALHFYADSEHFMVSLDRWEDVSGEPSNVLFNTSIDETEYIEDGHVAREALAPSPPDSEPAEGAGHLDAGDALRAKLADPETMQRVTERAAEQQDAMLERRDAVGLARLFHDTYERLAPQYGYETRQETREFDPDSANGRLMVTVCDKICEALSRTSDEGTGCVVPEAEQSADWLAHYFCTHDVDEMCHVHLNRIRRNLSRAHVPDAVRSFPNDMRREAARLEDAPGDKWARARADVLRRRADELDRAIAEQGGQAVPEGWKLVPVEPTEEMLEAVRGRAVYPRARELVDSDYRDMLAAAPQPDQEGKP